ncbi:MAG: YraN family protein [Holosporales bacterium]|jgi:putative endonuclease|nr:YraN family protein [Holosporales bacterium]
MDGRYATPAKQRERRAANSNRSYYIGRGFGDIAVGNAWVMPTYEKGVSAESCASRKLSADGYEIVGRRVRTKYGEIDILAKNGDDLVAVEVKQRRTLDAARSCIATKQQKRISNAMLSIISERNELFENYRIDVICFDSVGRFDHIENAFPIEEFAC